jgi:hypothetical protein
MINQEYLKDVLVTLAEINKSQYSQIVDLTSELAALEETMRALDPTFADNFAQRRKQSAQKALASSQTALAQYDNLIHKMRDHLVS